MDRDEGRLDDAYAALDEGEPQRALAIASEISASHPGRWLLECSAWMELGDLSRAGAALARAQDEGLGAADLDYLWSSGELALREWRIADAERDFARVAREERSAGVLERLSFCAELGGDFARADALYREARRADPDACPRIARLSTDEFEAVVREAIEELPEPFQALLEETEVLVAPLPTAELARPRPPAETPPDLLGLFIGPSRLEWVESSGAEPTPVMYLFQRNLERASGDLDELRHEIAVTFYHEFGHMLGFDEDGVADLGLE